MLMILLQKKLMQLFCVLLIHLPVQKIAKKCNDANIPLFCISALPDQKGEGKPVSIVSGDWYQVGFLNGQYIGKKYPEAKCAREVSFNR